MAKSVKQMAAESYARHRTKRQAENRARWAANKDRYEKTALEWRATPEGRAKWMCCAARARGRKRGIVFELTPADIQPILERGTCEVTGLPFDMRADHGRRVSPWAPSLDRTDPSRGYTRDNVKVVVHIFNLMKSDFTMAEVDHLAAAVVRRAR